MSKFKTKHHGYNDDEVKSALQKDIRRGIEDRAYFWAIELVNEYIESDKGKSQWSWLINRLRIICYEDIGLANPDVVFQVSKALDDLNQMMDSYIKNIRIYQSTKKEKDKPRDDWMILLAYIILLMCRSNKSRLADHFKVFNKLVWNQKNFDIPDYALDYHTSKGNELGRHKNNKKGVEHFINHGEKLVNEVELEDSEFWKKQAYKCWRSKYE